MKNLQKLVDAHNFLCEVSTSGNGTIQMAQAIVLLREIIAEEVQATKDEGIQTVEEGTASEEGSVQ